MKKVKSIFKKALAMMGENEVKAWGIGCLLYTSPSPRDCS